MSKTAKELESIRLALLNGSEEKQGATETKLAANRVQKQQNRSGAPARVELGKGRKRGGV